MIRLVVLDVDGVLTNGEVLLDQQGNESKSLFFRVESAFPYATIASALWSCHG